MKSLKDAPWNAARQPQEPRVSALRSQQAVYKLQLFRQGDVLKDCKKDGSVAESEGVQNGWKDISSLRIGPPPPPYF